MKWKDLTPNQLRELGTELDDIAHDKSPDVESIEQEVGFDLVAGLKCVARRLRREADRRAEKILSKTEPLTDVDKKALGEG